MPKVNVERNTFVKGLITEASPLTFPENASIAESNFVLNRDGSRQRRLGMDYEDTGSLIATGETLTSFATSAISGFRWENVGNDASKTFGVVQVGNKIWFVDGFKDTLSTNVISHVVDAINPMNNNPIELSTAYANEPIQFASIYGKLIMVSKLIPLPLVVDVTFDSNDDAVIATTPLDIKVRDIWGIDESVDVDERIATIDKIHEYNLFNQGWPTDLRSAIIIGSNNLQQTILHENYKIGADEHFYPSNADIHTLGINASDAFNPNKLRETEVGSRAAPRGRVLLDPFNRGQGRRSFISGLPVASVFSTEALDTIPLDNNVDASISTIAAHAGRLFYAGMEGDTDNGDDKSPSLASTIFFTQLSTNKDGWGKCHTENDPTSEEFSDLLPTDGGTIVIPEASKILKLVSSGANLVIIADNGVWSLSGTDGIFTADSFALGKVTNIGAVNAASVVEAEGVVYYWSKAGVYVLTPDQVSGRLQAQNITETTIQTLYIAIPSVGRANAVGRYDSDSRKISWLYNDTASYDGLNNINNYNKELVLDTVLGSFYTHSLGETATESPYVAGYLPTGGFNVLTQPINIVAGPDNVIVGVDNVAILTTVRSTGESRTKYITIKPTASVSFTFSLYNEETFLDWKTDDTVGVDAPAHMVSGYELFGDTARDKNINYLTAHFKRTESGFVQVGDDLEAINPSSCMISSQWDFANSAASGKFGTSFQAYKLPRNFTPTVASVTFDQGWDVVTTKNKVRGSGRAFSMRLDTEAGKDLHIYGWSINAGGNASV